MALDTSAEPPVAPVLAVPDSQPPPSQWHLLLAEDNVVNQKLAVRVLEKYGYTVVVASNGKEALAALSREPFDLVLMDVQMSEMDGFEATAAIRLQERQTCANHCHDRPRHARRPRALLGSRNGRICRKAPPPSRTRYSHRASAHTSTGRGYVWLSRCRYRLLSIALPSFPQPVVPRPSHWDTPEPQPSARLRRRSRWLQHHATPCCAPLRRATERALRPPPSPCARSRGRRRRAAGRHGEQGVCTSFYVAAVVKPP